MRKKKTWFYWHVLPCLACVFPEMHFSFPCLEHFRMSTSQYNFARLCVHLLSIEKGVALPCLIDFLSHMTFVLLRGAPTRIGKKGKKGGSSKGFRN